MAGIYLHIPFCRQKCNYCNFYSVASHKMQQGFIPALMHEIELQREYLEGEAVETVYFGGGTPSFIQSGKISALLDQIKKNFVMSDQAEITLEANPDDISPSKIIEWKNIGINRVSLGIQSFHEADLAYLYRSHNGATARSALENLINAGIQNINVDLIYGIPTLTPALWLQNLDQLLQYNIPHLSAYWLTVEEGTALKKQIAYRKKAIPGDEEGIQHFQLLREWATEHDFVHYEISNLAKDGYFSRHNRNYWNGAKYLGLGPSAHSFNGSSRQWNVNSIHIYKDSINKDIVPAEREESSILNRYDETIMTGLRTMWGVDLDQLQKVFGPQIFSRCLVQAQPHLTEGTLLMEGHYLKLDPGAFLISDGIIADLFIEPSDLHA